MNSDKGGELTRHSSDELDDQARDEIEHETAPFLGKVESPVSESSINRFWRLRLFSLLAGTAVTVAVALVVTIQFLTSKSFPSEIIVNDNAPSAPRLRPSSEYLLSQNLEFTEPTTRRYQWTISDTIFNPDGVYRPMMLINNQFPGPLIECSEGDTIVVDVRNRASNATSIHFHGLYQNGTNSMDGTVGVTQCPIAPNANFTYTFTVEFQDGTYWYHAHHSAQSSDGLVGPMVVHPRAPIDDPEEVSLASDRIVMIQEHYYNTSAALLMDYLQSDKENEEPVPYNGLINGRGYRDCSSLPGWNCSQANFNEQALEELELEPGRRHRLRFIHTGAMADFQVQVDDHPLYIIEVDGTRVYPEPFETLSILPAQRYSAILSANTSSASAFWMRARMVTHCFATENRLLLSEVKAIVRYKGKHSVGEPSSTAFTDRNGVECRDLNTSSLKPVVASRAPKSTTSAFLRANFEIGDWRLSRGFFNASSWRTNITSPVLHRYVDSKYTAMDITRSTAINDQIFEPLNEFVYQTSGIQVVDIIISNFDDGAHPFHLHGHKFFILKQSDSGYPPETMEQLEGDLEASGALENPLRRDTLTVPGYGWAAVRVVLDNPGVWAFHCHNTWHGEAGMMMVFAARVDDIVQWDRGDSGRALCGLPGVEKGMRVSDDYWIGNFGSS